MFTWSVIGVLQGLGIAISRVMHELLGIRKCCLLAFLKRNINHFGHEGSTREGRC